MIFAQFAKIIVLDQVLQYDICTGCKKALWSAVCLAFLLISKRQLLMYLSVLVYWHGIQCISQNMAQLVHLGITIDLQSVVVTGLSLCCGFQAEMLDHQALPRIV
jgi:hypothetical protein